MKKVLSATFLLLAILQTTAQSAIPALPKSKHRFIVIAHRGDYTQSPENTVAAFTDAIHNGADYVEMDLRTTKDSVLVIMHDATVDRTSNGTGKVSELDYAAIKQLKIKGNADTARIYSIPSFEEALAVCKNNICIYLDFKNASVAATWALIKKYGMQQQFIVYINSAQQFAEWKKLVPAAPLMVSLPGQVKDETALASFIAQTPVALLDGNYNSYTTAMVAAAGKAGIPVWPDIQSPNESANWDAALQLGFKGLQTDHPKQLILYLEQKGWR